MSKFKIKAGEKYGTATLEDEQGNVIELRLTQEEFFRKICRVSNRKVEDINKKRTELNQITS